MCGGEEALPIIFIPVKGKVLAAPLLTCFYWSLESSLAVVRHSSHLLLTPGSLLPVLQFLEHLDV